jgi:hypothetical protein
MSTELVEGLIALTSAILVVGVPFLIAFGKRIATKLNALAGTKIVDEPDVEPLVRKSVAYAEEQASKYLRGLAEQGPRSGAEKREVAKHAARILGVKASDEQLEVMIDAEVQQVKRTASSSILPPAGTAGTSMFSIPPLPSVSAADISPRPSTLRDPRELSAPVITREPATSPERPSAKRGAP